jgi:hypothetical protein
LPISPKRNVGLLNDKHASARSRTRLDDPQVHKRKSFTALASRSVTVVSRYWTNAPASLLSAALRACHMSIEVLPLKSLRRRVNWRIWTQWPLVAKSGIGLPPASSPVEATAAEQKNNDYDDKKRGYVHGFYVLGQIVHSVADTTQAPFSSMRCSSVVAT